MWQNIDWSKINWANVVVGITAVYGAVLATWTLVAQLRANKPSIKILLEIAPYLEQQDEAGGMVRLRASDITETSVIAGGIDAWQKITVVSVTALNTGSRDVVLTSWGIMLKNNTNLLSYDLISPRATLTPGKHYEQDVTTELLLQIVRARCKPLKGRKVKLRSFYKDNGGKVYKSKLFSLVLDDSDAPKAV